MFTGLSMPSIDSLQRAVSRAAAAAQRHPRRIALGVLAVLGGFAATAFGIAPMAPDAAELPRAWVTEDVSVPGLAQQTEALAVHELQLRRHDATRGSDTADTLLRRLGVADPAAARFLRSDRDARRLLDGRGGKLVQASTAADGTLLELVARFPALDAAQAATHFTRLTLTRRDGSFASRLETAPLQRQQRIGSGKVRTTLWAATDEARLSDAIASQLIEIFSGDIDFHRRLTRGDSFRVVYEALTADDQPITWNDGTGRILAAEFSNRGRSYEAVWFAEADGGKGSYLSPDGQSLRHAFLASPLEFSRVTSGFEMRLHPILNNWRAHHGIDYGAPKGTPVFTVGDGVVEFAGRQSGYGNVVEVRHDTRQTTLYAHLSAIQVEVGQKLQQGQQIGQVGSTGWATGPHLHFEFRVDGDFQDPQRIAESGTLRALDPVAKRQFQQLAQVAKQQLATARSVAGFRSDTE